MELCFDLTRSIDFHADAARSIKAKAVAGKVAGLSERGDSTRWQATFFGLRFRITTEIQGYARPFEFDDVMARGMFRTFLHNYRFTTEGGKTRLKDTFIFESRWGIPGKLIDRWFLLRPMRTAQIERLEAIKSALESGRATSYVAGL